MDILNILSANLRLRDAIIKIPDMMNRAEELGWKTVAFTDHESVSSWVKVEKEAKNHPDLKVIRGNEIYLVRNGLNSDNFNKDIDRYWHFILLAKDLIGAKQIMEISTRAWRRSYMARGMRRVPTYYQDLFDVISANPGHVVGSTACLGGVLPTQILRGTSEEKLAVWIQQMDNIFGHGNFFFEMQPSNNKEQIIVNKKLLEFSEKFDIRYIITTDSHYLKKEDRAIHKAYLNAQNGDREVDDFYATTYLMGDDEIRSYFKYFTVEQIEAAYQTIQDIADSCEDFSLMKPLKIPELKWRELPWNCKNIPNLAFYIHQMPTLEKFLYSIYKSDNYLVGAVIAGIQNHKDLQNSEAYAALEDNLQRTWESSEVNKARWSAYYLNLQKNIDECWNAGTIVGPARGSGGGFVLLYCLDVIQMNCLREPTPMYPWRFLNPARVSVLDIDTDIEGGKRAQVLQHLRDVYGEDRVANVATFRTEKSKSAVLTAARGLGIDVDIAQYIASLIPADRGQLRSLDQCMYGDEEHEWAPIKQFVFEMTKNYPELWDVAHGIEGLICGSGIHAGGVIFVDEPFTESTGLMRAPDGTVCTAFELHDCEDVSLIKIDLLSVEAMDKIHNCIDLLCDYGYAERKATLRETYESIVGVYNLERDDPKMWGMVLEHKIGSLFQMEKQSGIQGIAIAKPESIDELAVLNSVIRLMAPEPGAEQPLEMWARYRANINEWYDEMRRYGLHDEDIKWLAHHPAIHDGICESQEGLMSLVQEEKLGGNDLSFADKCRKAIAKKQGKLFEECEKHYFDNAKEKGCDMVLAHYVWDVVFKPQRGYSFNASHTHAYSLIALQEMNLAYKYPIMFWNCACLISDAGGNDEEEIDEEAIEETKAEEPYYEEMEEFDEDEDTEVSSYDEDDGANGYPATIVVTESGKKKKKVKATNYGKIATAIGKIAATGVRIAPPDINKSTFTFSPDIEGNAIRYGLSGITRIGTDLIRSIIDNRPFSGIFDFLNRVKVNKPQMINLIKSGAFDGFGDRIEVMHQYIDSVSDTKKRITLQNMKMLIDFELIPDDYDTERRVYNFNKYIKKMKLDATYYGLDEIGYNFYASRFDLDKLEVCDETESGFKIKQVSWDNIYQHHMDIIRPWVQKHAAELLKEVNDRLTRDMWNKYCLGSISKWEMDSISCYIHEHELAHAYHPNVIDYDDLPEEPRVDRVVPIKGKLIPIFHLDRIMGTVLDRDKAKKLVTLLTTDGVVTVKVYGVFQVYDKQISERGADGKKHVLEKSCFSRGNKIIVTGMREGDNFVAKKYKNTPYHRIEIIERVNEDGTIETRTRGDEE